MSAPSSCVFVCAAVLAAAATTGCVQRAYQPDFSQRAIYGTAIMQPRDPDAGRDPAVTPWTVGGEGVTLGAGHYSFAMQFDVTTPQMVEWTVSCPSAVESGSIITGQPGRYTAHAVLTTSSSGVCAVTASTDDNNAVGTFLITNVAEDYQVAAIDAENDVIELNEGTIDYTPNLGVGDNEDGALQGLYAVESEDQQREREQRHVRTIRVYRNDPPPTLTIRDKDGEVRTVPWVVTRDRRFDKTTHAPDTSGNWGSRWERTETYRMDDGKSDDPDAKNDSTAGTFVRPR